MGSTRGGVAPLWALGEVVTDKGRKFMGEFDSFLAQHEITHRLASRQHPHSDELAKRKMQTWKRLLRKCLLDGGGKD